MVGQLLLRGMIVGLLAGLLGFGVARTFGEPQVDRAIAFEQQEAKARQEAPEPELVSRHTQAGLGLFTGVVVYGAALGGILSLAFAFLYGRLGRLDARSTAALLALVGFIVLIVVPGLKYPPNPPSVGDPDTIGYRTALYFVMVALSLVASIAVYTLGRGLVDRLGAWASTLTATAGYVVAVAVIQIVMPGINEVPRGFSADLLWNFRLASFAIQAVLWAALGLGFGALASRLLEDHPIVGGKGRAGLPGATESR